MQKQSQRLMIADAMRSESDMHQIQISNNWILAHAKTTNTCSCKNNKHLLICKNPYATGGGGFGATPFSSSGSRGGGQKKALLAAEVDRLDKIARKYERGDIAKVDWLDGLVFQEIENIKQVRVFEYSMPRDKTEIFYQL